MVKHTKGFKGLSKKVLSAILAASMIMTSSSFVMAAEPTDVAVESVAEDAATGRTAYAEEQVEVIVNGGAEMTFTGEEQKPEVTIKVAGGEEQGVEDGNFTVEYLGDWTNATANATVAPQVRLTFQNDLGGTAQITKNVTIAQVNLNSAEVKLNDMANAFEYNGQEQVPNVSASVTLGSGDDAYDYTLQSGDYELQPCVAGDNTDVDAVEVGEYDVNVKGKGNFTGQKTLRGTDGGSVYEILPTAMTSDLVSVTTAEVPYGTLRENIRDYIKVTDINLEKDLVAGTDYYITIDGEDGDETCGDLGVHDFVITPHDAKNYDRGEIKGQYTVVQSLSLATMLSGIEYETVYNADEEVDVFEDAVAEIKKAIAEAEVKDSEYEIVTEEADWNNAGEYTLTVKGLQIYDGQEVSIPVVVSPKLIEETSVNAFNSKHPTSGDLSAPNVEVKDGDEVLVEGTDYTYEVVEEDDVTYVVVTGIGNYTTATKDQESLKVKVDTKTKMDLADASISAEVIKDNIVYAGKPITLGASDLSVTERDGSKIITLKWGVDYTIDTAKNPYKDNNKPGTASVTITGMGKYEGTRTIEFEIAGESFADDYTATMPESFKLGTSVQDVKDSITVRPKEGTGIYTRESVEFYQDGKKVNVTGSFNKGGVYTARISAKENKYAGTYIELTFTVLGEDVSDDMKVAEIADQVYTGSQITPSVTVTSEDGKTTYKAGEDYEVVYGENVQAGNNAGSVTVNMIGEYSGSSTVYFNITKADQTITMTNPLQERDLANGSRTTTSKNCTLKLGFGVPDTMNLSYESSDKSVATVNNGVITYQGVGECTITVTANETNNCKAVSLPITVKVGKVGTPTFTPSVTSKTAAKSITVTSSTVRGADGFEVQYSVRSDWWRASTVDFDGTNGKLYRQTIKTYHSNKKYYIRVRAYQIVDGAKVYSDWSPAKTATTK